MKNKQGNSMQSIAAKYWAFSTVSCLFFPNGLGLATYLGVNGDNVPFFSWMSQLDGVLPFYEDYFIFIWATMPLWLIYACVATRKDVPIGPPITAMRVILMAFVSLAFILAIVFSDSHLDEGVRLWRNQMMVAGARNRIVGSVIWGGLSYFSFFMLSAFFIATPRNIGRLMNGND